MPTTPDSPLELLAHAKLNLTLEVLGRRADGYHEIRSVFQEIALADRLVLHPAEGLSLECSAPGLAGESNLAMAAARALAEATGCTLGARIVLEKHIPAAGGLGGGSSDAAAALRGLNALWRLGLSTERLLALAARLGSDVPFFLAGGTALASGRGELLQPLPPLPETWFVLLFPPYPEVAGKTGRLYSLLNRGHYTDGAASRRLAEALASGRFDASHLYNVFESVAPQVFMGIEEHMQALRDAGAERVHLAGSGPTLYALVHSREHGEVVARRLDADGRRCAVTHSVAHSP